MEWFKFYHNKWISDLAIGHLYPEDRLCFITLLCLAAQRDDRNGLVLRVNEHELITLTRLPVNVYDDDKSPYHKALGCLSRMADAGLIELRPNDEVLIKNFERRQISNLTGAERAKRYREKHKVTTVTPQRDDRNAREDKRRVEKSREDNIKDIVAANAVTPADEAIEFFSGGNVYQEVLQALSVKIPQDRAERELEKFTLYWTEKNTTGTKQRWQQERTFEVKRRLYTWLSRVKETRQHITKGKDFV